MGEWINRRGRVFWCDQYALNEQDTAFSRYDPDRIVRDLLWTGADIVVLYATNQHGIAYYPSQIWPQHPGLRGRDYVGELMERLRRHGRPVVLYVNWEDSKHPEWWRWTLKDEGKQRPQFPLVRWADPSRPNWTVYNVTSTGLASPVPCVNSPHRAQVMAVLEEILTRYRPEGVHLDMLLFKDICICQYCRPALERICGTGRITEEVLEANWNHVIDWHTECCASVIREASQLARKHGAAFLPNFFAPPIQEAVTGNGRLWLDALDAAVSECFEAFNAPRTDLNTTSLMVRWHHAIRKPSWILRTGHPLYYAHWPLTKAQWEISAAACKANGCKVFGPCGIGARPDTTYAAGMLEAIRHGMDFFMEDADLDEGAESAASVALCFSWQTRHYAPRRPEEQQWAREFVGWGRLLIEEHIPFDMVIAEDVADAGALAQYELVVLPALSHLSQTFCDAIRQYVERGGRVIATAGTSLFDERGNPLPGFALGDVLGVSLKGRVRGHFAMEEGQDAAPASGWFWQVESAGECLVRRVEVDSAGGVWSGLDPLPVALSPWPTVSIHRLGKGCAFYVAYGVGEYFELHGDAHIGRQMAWMVDKALPQRQVLVRAPRTVEVTLWRQGGAAGRLIVHLANRTVPWTLPTMSRQITEIIPVHGVEVTLRPPFARFRVGARHAAYSHEVRGDFLTVRLDKMGAYAAIVIEQAP